MQKNLQTTEDIKSYKKFKTYCEYFGSDICVYDPNKFICIDDLLDFASDLNDKNIYAYCMENIDKLDSGASETNKRLCKTYTKIHYNSNIFNICSYICKINFPDQFDEICGYRIRPEIRETLFELAIKQNDHQLLFHVITVGDRNIAKHVPYRLESKILSIFTPKATIFIADQYSVTFSKYFLTDILLTTNYKYINKCAFARYMNVIKRDNYGRSPVIVLLNKLIKDKCIRYFKIVLDDFNEDIVIIRHVIRAMNGGNIFQSYLKNFIHNMAHDEIEDILDNYKGGIIIYKFLVKTVISHIIDHSINYLIEYKESNGIKNLYYLFTQVEKNECPSIVGDTITSLDLCLYFLHRRNKTNYVRLNDKKIIYKTIVNILQRFTTKNLTRLSLYYV